MSVLTVLLADDHPVFRDGMKRLIESQPDMRVVAEASDGREAIARAVEFAPQLVVMDISMGPVSGVEATRELRQRCPETRILVVTVHEDRSYVQELLEAGASGYMVKRAAAEELIAALRAVATKGMHIDTRVAGRLVASLFAPRAGTSGTGGVPSERESEVLRLIARGYTNKEIAGQLSVSVKTVETYKSRAMEKLGLRSRVDIVRYAGESGWLRV